MTRARILAAAAAATLLLAAMPTLARAGYYPSWGGWVRVPGGPAWSTGTACQPEHLPVIRWHGRRVNLDVHGPVRWRTVFPAPSNIVMWWSIYRLGGEDCATARANFPRAAWDVNMRPVQPSTGTVTGRG